MTPEQRGEAAAFLPPYQNPAAPELVASVIRRARAAGISADISRGQLATLLSDTAAVISRLLDAERDIEALRRTLATAVATATDLPDDGLSAGDLLRLYTAAGLDLTADIEHAETLRAAEQLAGAR
jgi:hypothetical protein